MAVTFVANGSMVPDATTTTLTVSAPTCLDDDILLAHIYGKNRQVVTAPAGWASVVEYDDGTNNQRLSVFWKRAVAASDSGAAFNFTKPVDDNLLFVGVISAWRGCVKVGSPIDPGTPSTRRNAASDNVNFNTFDPTYPCHVVAMSSYNTNATTAGAISGTDPTFSIRYDLEQNSANNNSSFCHSGDSSGAATGGRQFATSSTTDAANMGVIFGLIEGTIAARARNYSRRRRV